MSINFSLLNVSEDSKKINNIEIGRNSPGNKEGNELERWKEKGFLICVAEVADKLWIIAV